MPGVRIRHTPYARVLNAKSIVETVEKLQARVVERFPGSGLAGVCADLATTARATSTRVSALARPYYGLRLVAVLAVVAGLAAQVFVADVVNWSVILRRADAVGLSQGLDATVNLLILAFGAIWFVLTLEVRLKRRRIMRRLYEFRSLAHVVDMHQLTKDPTVILGGGAPTASSPKRLMTEFELSRYLDYCSEMLALIAKLAALYAEQVQDEIVIGAVNEIEELTSDLGRKIWQKIMIISQLDERRLVK